MTERCGFIKADFMNIPKPPNTYDAVYAIDATCHAPDAVKCYKVQGRAGRLAGWRGGQAALGMCHVLGCTCMRVQALTGEVYARARTQEIFKVLKPGCAFAGYEWCSTNLYNPSSTAHRCVVCLGSDKAMFRFRFSRCGGGSSSRSRHVRGVAWRSCVACTARTPHASSACCRCSQGHHGRD